MKKKLSNQSNFFDWFWVYILVLVVLIFASLSLFVIKKTTPHPQIFVNKTLPENSFIDTVGVPTRLKIPTIEVDSYVESVGLTPEGAMDIPSDADNVAWYNRGPRPGEQGSAVIDGHFDKEDQSPAVFAKLDQLKVGDIIYLENDQGETLEFKVKESRMYDVNDSTEEIFNNDEGIFLNLITCAGSWDVQKKDYNQRRVIFSELVK